MCTLTEVIRRIIFSITAFSIALIISACGGGNGGGENLSPTPSFPSSQASSSTLISSSETSLSSHASNSSVASFPVLDVNSPDGLSQAIYFDGGYSLTANIPAPSDPTGGNIIVNSEIAITGGGSTQFDLTAQDIPNGMHVHAYLIQIEGSKTSFVIPVNANGQPYSQANAISTIPNKIERFSMHKTTVNGMAAPNPPARLNCSGYPNIEITASGMPSSTPSYEAPAQVYAYLQAQVPPFTPPTYLIPSMSRERRNWTAPTTVNIKAVKVGGGKLQVTLTWNNEADVDLYLEEPDGNIIFFGNEKSNAGDGYLDIDDIDGFGPENIFYEKNVPPGKYSVRTELWSPAPNNQPTNYTVKVKYNNNSQIFNGSLFEERETDDITTFTMNSNGTTNGTSSGVGSAAPGSYKTKPNTLLGSRACDGYTNTNYIEHFEKNSNGLDVQLHTLCAGAFNYYAMYKKAIEMGYSEAEANITYQHFEKAALVATDFYNNAR